MPSRPRKPAPPPPPPFPALPPDWVSDLHDIEETFVTDGHLANHLSALNDLLLDNPGTPFLAFLTARAALMVGGTSVSTAVDALDQVSEEDLPMMHPIRALLDPSLAMRGNAADLSTGQAREGFVGIWESFPCNYYSYRYSLFKDETIAAIVESIDGTMPAFMAEFPAPRVAEASSGGGVSDFGASAEASTSMGVRQSLLPVDVDPLEDSSPTEDDYEGPNNDVDTSVSSEDLPSPSAEGLTQLVMDCWYYWNKGLNEYNLEKYSKSITSHEKALHSILTYLTYRFPDS